ncbi:hypothetical protein [Pseudoalteromonas sp. NBT06-2]|uniref:hypothetical protein n=1 Tax=Pseudoalteromonas sp. NBT06-2 TaxID=2025950 RepID=UPI001BAE8716|nr:hypothetical protein [Pseudoalteromonas sp. NBT06-2]
MEIDPFTIPKNWTVNRAFDEGTAPPFATVWVAEANGEEVKLPNGKIFCPPSGSLIVVAEDYGTEEDAHGNQVERNRGLQLSARPVARRIKKKEEQLLKGILSNHTKVEPGPADLSIRKGGKLDKGTGASVEKEMAAEGIKWTDSYKATGSRKLSAQIMIERLSATKEQDFERPHIYFFKTCRYCIKFLPEHHRNENNPEEVAKGPDDHLWDAIAYRLTQKAKPKTITRKGFF